MTSKIYNYKNILSTMLRFFPLAWLIIYASTFAQPTDIKILQSTSEGVVVEYTPRYLTPEKFISNGNEFIRYHFANGKIVGPNIPGSPEMAVRSALLKFPGTQNNTIEIINLDYEEISNVTLAPVPYFERGDVDPVPKYILNPDAYNVLGYLPTEAGSLVNIGETRGVFLGELRFNPLQYDPSRRHLRKCNRIVARINFGAAEKLHKYTASVNGLALNEDAFRSLPSEIQTAGKASIYNSVLNSGSWYRFTISEDGMYKLTGQALLDAGIPTSTDIRTIKIFSNSGIELPYSPTVKADDDLLQNAIYIHDAGTSGQLDAADFIVFYGKSTHGWIYSRAIKSFNHYINHYSESNVYWLTYGGEPSKLMASISSMSDPDPYKPSTVVNKFFREDDKINVFSSGIEWLGESFNSGDQIVYRQLLPGIDLNQSMKYRYNLGASSSAYSQFTLEEHDGSLRVINISPSGSDLRFVSSEINITPAFSDAESRLRFKFSTTGSGGTGYLDWYEIFYQRFLNAQNDVFNFHTHDTTVAGEYTIKGFSGGEVSVFDVTKFDSVVVIANPYVSVDTCSFQTTLTSGTVKEFYVVGQNGFKTPSTLTTVRNQNLHGDPAEASYIIITHSDFLSAAQRLKAFREQSGNGYLKTLIVDVNQIYNEFGGGLLSPMAIRNYLSYVYKNWSIPPKYVLLLGDGDYDYKRILGVTNPNWIPPWESQESFRELYTYTTDDDYGIFFSGSRVNVGIGRLTARTSEEANAMVDKIIDYETKSIVDSWKLNFTFVADDGPQAAGITDGLIHTQQADDISNMVPPVFEKKKIYLYDYLTIFTASGRRKPDVNIAIQNAINQGTLILNFTGHGNPRLWTHEAVFVRETDFPLLHNKGKYFFLVAATCNYANFDQLSDRSSGELLVNLSNAGAIGVFSATRPVYASQNFDLNKTFYHYLLDTVQYGKLRSQRLGDIVYRTKQDRNDDNDRKYFLLGDPALVLSFPKLVASIDSINNRPSSDSIRIKALERASFKATVRDTATDNPVNFTGQAQVVVYDANKSIKLIAPEINRTMTYTASGSIIFRGQNSIKNGLLRSDFIVPKDIAYSDSPGRITIYFSNDSTDGAGFTNITVNGTNPDALPDSLGPQIKLYLDRKSFRPGDVVGSSPTLIAELSDSNGLNTSGASIGHRLEAWLDEKPESFDLSDYYKSKLDTYTEGVIEYPLGTLSKGTHKLRLRAWDTYNNSSTEETMFNVVSGDGLKISNVFNYPNPFSSATVFTFEHNQVVNIDVQVKIYTVAGRLIQTIKQNNIANQFARIPWDGRDRDGDVPANGVYLYKIIAKTQDGRFSSEALGKLSVLK